MEYDVAVFIGRFQPFHLEHLEVVKQALELAPKVIIGIGSATAAPNIKNPFTYEERRQMISNCISASDYHRLQFVPLRDYHYSDSIWLAQVQQEVGKHCKPGSSIVLVGAFKDKSSYYMNLFGDWDTFHIPQKRFLNALEIRHSLFKRDEKLMEFNVYHPENARRSLVDWSWINDVPNEVEAWLRSNYFETQRYHDHCLEWWDYKVYKEQWGTGPFVTVDAVVTCAGHALVIKRKDRPGKGCLALPGGFLKLDERIEDGAIRELKEETGINLPKVSLKQKIVDSHVFDYPGRSLRGRTITHAFHFKLSNAGLLPICAGSDAETVMWVPLYDLFQKETEYFEDHHTILSYFTMRS